MSETTHVLGAGYRRVRGTDIFGPDAKYRGFVYVAVTPGPLVFEGEVTPKHEDGKQSLCLQVEDGEHGHTFVRVMSWDETLQHPELAQFIGKRIRVTVELA